MGESILQAQLVDSAIDESGLLDLFETWWGAWPSGQKTGKKDAIKAWVKVFKKDPGIPTHDCKHFAETVLIHAIKEQVAWRKAVFDKYPNAEDRKKKDIFVPRLPMPATWLNGGRWLDPVQKLPGAEADAPKAVASRCIDCELPAEVFVGEERLCAWHWTKRYNREHLQLLADSLKRLGLERKPDESRADWSERCRQYALASSWQITS